MFWQFGRRLDSLELTNWHCLCDCVWGVLTWTL